MPNKRILKKQHLQKGDSKKQIFLLDDQILYLTFQVLISLIAISVFISTNSSTIQKLNEMLVNASPSLYIIYYPSSRHLNMWKFAADIFERCAGLTPMKAFLKYIFQRISNDFLDHEPNIDFKKGELQLLDLPLSAKKINQTFLMSSPYIMHSGVIRRLKIVLPNIVDIASKSIEVEVSGFELVFYPNKNFLQRFNDQMKQMKQNSKFYDVEENVRDTIQFKEDDTLDFFKEIIRQILTNIKVNVNNVCIKVFMNTPSQNKNNPKPQFYSMLRIPSIVVERSRDEESNETEDIEKYQLKIQQITTHLLREDVRFPEYDNVKAKQADFPYIQPLASNPSTLMLIGNKNLETDSQSILLFFTIKKQLKTRTRKFIVKGTIPNIQFMVEPFQIKVLENFLTQLQEFKKLYHFSMSQLRREDSEFFGKITDVSRDFSVREGMRITMDLHSSMDIFSSIVMSFQQPHAKENHLKKHGYFDSLLEDNNRGMTELKAGVGDFNKKLDKQTKAKIKQKMETKYNTVFKSNVDIGFIRVYCLKHNSSNTLIDYQRVWTSYNKNKPVLINQHIPCSYFMLNIKQISIESDDKEVIALTVKKIVLLNVRLAQNKQTQQFHESEDIFHSFQTIERSFPNSSHKYKESDTKQIKQDHKKLKKLVQFQKSLHHHYCANYLFWIAIKDPQKHKKTYYTQIHCPNSQPENSQTELFTFGLSVKLIKPGTKESKTSIGVERVGVFLDAEVVKDFVNIVYPLFMYRNLVMSINLKKQELNSTLEPKINLRSSSSKLNHLAYSRYDMTSSPDLYQSQQSTRQQLKKETKSKQLIEISFKNISLTLTNTILEGDLIQNDRNKIKDSQSFGSNCFCQYHHKCVTVEVNKLKIRLDQRIKIFFRNSYVWIESLSNQKEFQRTMVMGTPNQELYNRIFIQPIKGSQEIQQKVSINIPHFKINIQKKECLQFVEIAQKFGQTYKSLKNYFEYLDKQFKKIDFSNSNNAPESKIKKTGTKTVDTQIIFHIQNFQATFLDIEVYISNLLIISQPKQTALKFNNLLILHMHKYQCLLKSVPIDIREKIKNYKEIDTSTVVVRITSKGKDIEPFTIQTRDKEFFNKLEIYNYSFSLLISQNQQKLEQSTKVIDLKASGKFGFMKRKQQLETISEEEDQQIISVALNQPIIIRLCQLKNYIILKQDIEEIKQVIAASKILEVLNEPPQKKRKDSDWAPRRKIKVNIKVRELSIDIFPYEDLRQSSSILSSTRSYLTLQNITAMLESSEKCSELGEHIQSNFVSLDFKKAEYYFLYFNDTDPLKNPLLLSKEELINYGFRRIGIVNSVFSSILHESSLCNKEPLIEISLKIDSLDGQCSSMTTVYLQHHIDTLVRMADVLFEKKQKIIKKMVEVEPEYSSDQEVEVIQEQSMKRQQLLKSSQESEFKSRTVDFLLSSPPSNLVKNIFLKLLDIKRISFFLYSGDDFNFSEGNEKIIVQESVYEINEKNEVVIKEQIPSSGNIEVKKRFRKKDVDKYTNMRFVSQGIQLQLCTFKQKYSSFKQNKKEKGLNMRAVFKIRTINWIMNKMGEDIFYLLKTTQRISIVFEIDGTKIKAKHFLPESIQAGYTSNLNFWWNEREQAKAHLNKMAYLIPVQESQQIIINNKQVIYQILAFVPKTKLTINLQMIGWKFLTNQEISTVELFFHGRLSKYLEDDNNKIIMKWITDTLTNNMGSILANTFLSLFSKAIWFFLNCIKHIIIFPGKVFRVLKK